ncbi:MAG: phage tail tape measure protein [Epibacterium sp.]|nr:phage tail tape measure protein [Epibacterium sp.]NQX74243.1 phage tail tape measure protein [Epibacterium sp.]
MAIKNDIVKTTVLMDGKQALNQLGKLEMELSELRQQTKGLRRDSEDYDKAMKKMRGVQKDIRARRKELGIEGMTMQQLIRYQRDLRREITNTTTRGTKDYQKLRAELVKVTNAVTRQRLEMRGMSSAWVQLGQSVRQSLSMFGPVAMITSLIYGLGAAVRQVSEANISLSETMADVQKNTELTNDELATLMDRLLKINTKTSQQELLELVTIGGKLGIRGVQDLEGFARAADKINVALGEDLGGDPIQTLKELGKLTNTFGLKKSLGIEKALIKVGSVLNDLGRSSEAAEQNVAEFTKRMGGLASVANISIQDIMGLGAASDLMGLSMEVSATALTQLISKMAGKNRKKFAKFAKDVDGNTMSLEAFTELINSDANEAFLSLLRGLKDNEGALTDFMEVLNGMGLEGQRVTQVVSSVAKNLDEVEKQQRIAQQAFEEGNSVLAEFDQKNRTVGANLAKVGKAISSRFVNSGFVRWLEEVTGRMADFVAVPVSEALQEQQMRLNVLVSAIQNVNDNQEVRNGLISKLQSEYPDFLGNLDAEKVTNEQLSTRLKEVNKQMMQKIILQQAEEELAEIFREQIALMDERINAETDLAALRAKTEEQHHGVARRFGATTRGGEQFDKTREIALIDDQLLELDERIKQAEARKQSLLAAFDLSGASPNVVTPDVVTPDPNATGGDGPAAVDEDGVLAELRRAFEQEMLLMKAVRADGLMEKEMFDAEYLLLEIEFLQALIEQRAAFGLDTVDQEQQLHDKRIELLEAREKKEADLAKKREKQDQTEQDNLTDMAIDADKNAKQTIADEEEKQRLKHEELRLQAESGAMAGLQAENMREAAQVMKDQIRGVIEGYIMQIVSVQIANALAKLPIPPPFNLAIATGLGTAAGAAVRSLTSFYYGGEVGETGEGMGRYGGDQYGNYSGVYATHGGEFVTPATVRNYPDVQAAIGVTKARMNGMTMTPPPTPGAVDVTSTLDASGMDAVAERMESGFAMFADAVNVLRQHGIEAKISRRESGRAYETGKEEYNQKETARNRGKL